MLFPNYSMHKRAKKIAWLREEFLQLQYPTVVSLAAKPTRQFSLHRLTYYYMRQNRVNWFRLTTGEKPAEISSVYISVNNKVALFQQPPPSLAEPRINCNKMPASNSDTHCHMQHTHTHTHTKEEICSDQRIYRSVKRGGGGGNCLARSKTNKKTLMCTAEIVQTLLATVSFTSTIAGNIYFWDNPI